MRISGKFSAAHIDIYTYSKDICRYPSFKLVGSEIHRKEAESQGVSPVDYLNRQHKPVRAS